MNTKLTALLGLSSLTLAYIYSQLTRLVLTYDLIIFVIILSGLTLSLAAATIISSKARR